MTATAFGQYVDLSEAARRVHNDIMGRWWDVLVMFHHAAQRSLKANTIRFEFLCVTDRPRPSKCQLKAVCGPDDEGAPCLTFMLPEED